MKHLFFLILILSCLSLWGQSEVEETPGEILSPDSPSTEELHGQDSLVPENAGSYDIRSQFAPKPLDVPPIMGEIQPQDDFMAWTIGGISVTGILGGIGLGVFGIYDAFGGFEQGFQARGVKQGLVVSAGGLMLMGSFGFLLADAMGYFFPQEPTAAPE